MAESWLDEEEETQTSSANVSQEALLKKILITLEEHTKETTHRFNSLDSANEEIIRLQTKLKDLQSKIVKFQTEIPKIYPTGAIFGVAGTVYGIFTANLIYFSVGLGMAITAIIGILEAKINARQGIV